MAYNQNIPQPSDKLKNSQPQLLSNFQSINTLISVDHVPFDDPSGNQGKHTFIHFPQQAATVATGAQEVGLVSLVGAYSGNTELSYVPINNNPGAPTNIAFTESLKTASNGWTITPSGLLMKWDTVTINAAAGPALDYLFIWPTVGNYRPFTQQPFFATYSMNVPTGTFPNVIFMMDITLTNAVRFNGQLLSPTGAGWPTFNVIVTAYGI